MMNHAESSEVRYSTKGAIIAADFAADAALRTYHYRNYPKGKPLLKIGEVQFADSREHRV